jgi:phosphoribosylformylglycinamidine synthase subunit PurQ / glutaminase
MSISMAVPKVIVLSGYGLNCEEETLFAFEKAGAKGDIVHINDLIGKSKSLSDYQILAFPGGFSYGDDTGSGMAYANKMRNNLKDQYFEFMSGDTLAIGICNGFQIMVNLGLLPAYKNSAENTKQVVALTHNTSARYRDRWVDLKFNSNSPWTKHIDTLSLPIAHGEGKFYADESMIKFLEDGDFIAAKYVNGEICQYQCLEPNPNGSLNDIASIIDYSGRLMGMMPHPERAINFTHRPDWTFLKEKYKREGKELPKDGPGLKIFENGVNYFK